MTPLQSVLWDVKQRIENDKKLSKLRQKVNSGKATYADTAAYSTHVGNLLGDTFAQHILSVSSELREALTVELLHDRYMDINAIIDRVQKSMDEAQGLHLAPQHAPFYDDRAHQIGSALADPTVPDETIKRRARAATATATKSMHDDRMKTEAKFRSRAGLKCFITRKAVSGCCAWCTAMAGRYAYGEEPDDIYRRHDNCDCTVTFENGRKRQNVWSKREWEAPEADAGAGEPVRLTAEQAERLQAEHGLTKLDESGKINKKLSDRMTNENVNSNGYGIFEFSDIEKEMSSSSIGRHTLAYIESDGLSIVMDYSPYQPDDTDGYIIGTTIYINAAIHVDETHVAETIIHECAHRQFSWNETQEDEVNCRIYEYLHSHESISDDNIKSIVDFVKQHYSEDPEGDFYGY